MNTVSIGVALSAVLAAASLAARQTPPAPPAQTPVFRTGVDLIQLDVSVLDKDRQPVRGLTQADFTVLEDGKPQTIQAFNAIDLPDVVTPATPWLRDVAPDVATNVIDNHRIFVLVLDDATMPMDLWAAEATRKSADSIIDRMGPDDLATVVFTRDNHGAQDLTNDRAKLKKAVATLSRQGNVPLENKTTRGFAPPPSGGRGPMPNVQDPPCWVYTSSMQVVQRAIEYLAVVPQRRKTLIYLSGGISVDIAQRKIIGPLFPGSEPDRKACGADVVNTMEDAFRAAQQANVNIYGMDPMGLRTDAHLGSWQGVSVEFLQTVSENTGGRAIVNTNDFEPGITQMFRENSSYYLLGYRPTNVKADGTFRRIEVKTSRPGLEVLTRKNYIAPKPPPPPGANVPPAPSPAVKALAEILPKSDLPLRLAAAPFAVPGKQTATVTLALGLRQPAQAQRMTDDVQVLVKTFTPEGKELDSTDQTIPVTVPPVRRGSEFTRYEVLAHVDMKPGRYEVRISTHSSAFDLRGSVYADVEVPDFAKAPLSMSGVVLSATPGLTAAPVEALTGIVPVLPTTEREFTRSDRVTAFLRVYQGSGGRPAAVTLTTRIVDGHGAVVLEKADTLGAESFGPSRAVDRTLALPLAQLAPGEYLMSFEASREKTIVRRDVRFTVK